MPSKKTAIRPDLFLNLDTLKKEREAEAKGATEEETALYSMSKTLGWKHFNRIAEDLVKELENMNDQAVMSGMTYEELGRNTVVLSLVRGIIRRLLTKVSDAREVCEPT